MKKHFHIISAILISGLVLFSSCLNSHARVSKLRDPIIGKDTVQIKATQGSAAGKP